MCMGAAEVLGRPIGAEERAEDAAIRGLRRRRPAAGVNEVISRDGVGCHMSDTGLRIQSLPRVSVIRPPRQSTNRSNAV